MKPGGSGKSLGEKDRVSDAAHAVQSTQLTRTITLPAQGLEVLASRREELELHATAVCHDYFT
jgi:hypothetical protein